MTIPTGNGNPQQVSDVSDDDSLLEDDTTVTPFNQNPVISIIKSGMFQDENGDTFAQVGETISYTFTVENTGDVTLTNVTVTDPLVTVSGGPSAESPGANDTTTFTATYTLVQGDVDNGFVNNQATATGDYTDAAGNPQQVSDLSDDDSNCWRMMTTVTPFNQRPGIAIIKSGTFQDENGDTFAQVGETISYTFTVENTGDVTLNNVTVTDPLVTVSGGPITLAPGAMTPRPSPRLTRWCRPTSTTALLTTRPPRPVTLPTAGDPQQVSDLSDDSLLEDDTTVTPFNQDPGHCHHQERHVQR